MKTAEESGAVAGPIGLVGLLWSGLGLVNALQYALNQAWQVEERGVKDKAVGMVWLLGAALLFVGASAVTRRLPWRAHIPGAVVGAIGMELLKVLGGIYVPRAVANSSALYGTLGVVFAVLAWLLFFGRLILYAGITNVVLWERKAGAVKTLVEVPAGGEVDPGDDVTRSGRVEKADLRA